MATKNVSELCDARREMQIASIELSAALCALANRIKQFGTLVTSSEKTIDGAHLNKIAEIYEDLARGLPALAEHADRVARYLHQLEATTPN